MKPEELFEHMSAIDDEVLARSEQAGGNANAGKETGLRRRNKTLIRAAVVVAAMLVIVSVAWIVKPDLFRRNEGEETKKKMTENERYLSQYLLAKAEYPEEMKIPSVEQYRNADGSVDYEQYDRAYEDWRRKVRQGRSTSTSLSAVVRNGIAVFTEKSLPKLFAEEAGKNRVYSPTNLYMALAMLAEITDGNTRAQILKVLGTSDVGELRAAVDDAWKTLYHDDGAITTILASSLWLRNDSSVSYIKETIDRLAANYHASVFSGTMGSEEYNKALRTWLNEQTGGLLEESVSQQSLDANTALAVATTLYYSAKWDQEFMGTAVKDKFHAGSGDIECDFMKQTITGYYYAGDRFAAVYKNFEYESNTLDNMIFFLPDEGVSVEELLEDPQVLAMLGCPYEQPQSKFITIHLSVPKFDVASDSNVSSCLQQLGITDAFTSGTADFSPIAENAKDFYLSKVDHSVRVQIDEEGVKAAAYTVLPLAGAEMPPEEEADFILDRPFLFAIRTMNGTPLFIGIVENP